MQVIPPRRWGGECLESAAKTFSLDGPPGECYCGPLALPRGACPRPFPTTRRPTFTGKKEAKEIERVREDEQKED